MTESNYIKKGIVATIIAGIFILTFFILKPIIIAIVFGLLFAYIFNPVYKKIKSLVKNKNLSAFLLLLLLVLIIAIPIAYLVPIIVNQAFETYVLLQNFNFTEVLSKYLQGDMLSSVARNLDNIIGKFFSTFLNQFTSMLVNLPSLLLQFAVFLFTFYFAIRDSDELKKYISSLSPFSKSTEDKFSKEFRGITNAIIFGQVFIGILQGLVLGAGLFFLGVPKAIILTFIASVVSMIPVLGSWMVWLPVSLILLATGQVFSGIFLFLYGALFVSTIDNLFRPYILSRQSNLPVALSVIGTIGGLYFFGISGLILGPLVLAYVLIIIEFYQKGKLKELFEK
ncbi:MAG: AI-2E family transporter [Nanoarchaeota archaeon]|nr:AI-2E family transporter [Nanoarchaeota archaeon]